MSEEQPGDQAPAAPAPQPPVLQGFAPPDLRQTLDPRYTEPLWTAGQPSPTLVQAAIGWGGDRPPRPPRWRRGLVAGATVLALAAAGTVVAVRPWERSDAVGRSGTAGSARPGAGQPDASRAATDPDAKARAEAVQHALATMNTALAEGDERRFLSVVLPGSDVFRSHQSQVFRGLRRMTFGTVEYRWTPDSYLTVPGLPQADGEAVVADVSRHYTLTPWDQRPVTEALGLTFARSASDGRWYLAGDADAADELAETAFAEPWQTGDVSVVSTKRVLVVGDPKTPATTRRLAGRLDRLVAGVGGLWGDRTWNGKVVVYAVTDPRFVKAWFGTRAATGRRTESTDPATFDAVVGPVWSEVDDGGPSGDPAGVRMVLTPGLIKAKDSAYVDQVLRHELTHVVTERFGRGQPPVWLVEGIAEYTAVRNRPVDPVAALEVRWLTPSQWKRLKNGSFALRMPTDQAEFYQGSNDQVSDAYTSAWFSCLYIADRYGEKKLVELYRRSAELSGADSDPDQVETRALADVLGTTRPALLKATLRYARDVRSAFV